MSTVVTYRPPNADVQPRPLITTVRVVAGPGHDVLHVWSRGKKAGTLAVEKGEGHLIADLLIRGTRDVEVTT